MTDEPPPDRPARLSPGVRSGIRWGLAVVALVGAGWALVAFAPRPARPHLVGDAGAASSEACGAFGAETPDPPDGLAGYVPCWLPDGFRYTANATRGNGATTTAPAPGTTPVADPYVLNYARPNGDGAPDTIQVITVYGAAEVTAGTTTVRGHLAELTTPVRADDPTLLRWTEVSGVNIRLSAWGDVSVDELERVAAQLTQR